MPAKAATRRKIQRFGTTAMRRKTATRLTLATIVSMFGVALARA